MSPEELKIFKEKVLNSELTLRIDQLDTRYSDIKDDILSYPGNTFLEQKYNFLRNIRTLPICKNCGGNVKYTRSYGYHTYCKKSCEIESIKILKSTRTKEEIELENLKRSQTIKEKYGEDFTNIAQVPITKEKIKETCNEKYGGDAPMVSREVLQKRKNNNMERWGVEEYSQTDICKNKVTKTNMRNLGVKTPFLLEKNMKLSRDGMEKKYGVKFPFQNPDILNHATEKLMEYHNSTDTFEKSKIKLINKYQKLIGDEYEILDMNEDRELTVKHPDGHTFITHKGTLYDRIKRGSFILSTVLNPLYSITSHSSHELELRSFLTNIGIEFEMNNKTFLENRKELDIFIPSHNIAIEMNGIYWHSSKYIDDELYHQNKSIECQKKGIELFHIFEDEWIYKKDIVKYMIKYKLDIPSENIISIDDCIIKNVDYKSSEEFLNNYHILGSMRSSVRYGLYHNDELLSLMTFVFSKSKEEFELVRYCTIPNTTISSDHYSYIFSYFTINNPNYPVVAYSNLAFDNGSLFMNLGFEFVTITKPESYWVINSKRKNHWEYTKEMMVKEGYDPSKYLAELMEDNGHYRIYSSGYLQWKYTTSNETI